MDATPEEWLPVVGYEGLYEVSNHGRVRSLDRVITHSDGRKRRFMGRLLRPSVARTPDYPVVSLANGASSRVHTLVLEAFVGPRPDGLVACHNDGNHYNNHLSNLRWDTYSANNLDLVKHGTHANAAKTHCKNNHEFTVANTIIRTEGGRKCRTCQYESNARSRERQHNYTH